MVKCTPSPTADIKMEAMPGAERGWGEMGWGGIEAGWGRGRGGRGRVEQVRVESKWRYAGVERNKSKV